MLLVVVMVDLMFEGRFIRFYVALEIKGWLF